MYRYAAITDTGPRYAVNDDRILVDGQILSEGALTGSITRAWLYAALCDGVGGMSGGYEAAELTLREMKELDADDVQRMDIRSAVERANRAVRAAQLRTGQRNGMRTTLAGLYLSQGSSYVVNAGDSRVYRSRGGELTRLSRDHSVVQNLIDAGEITEQEARCHPQRNLITKCVGDEERVNARIIDLTGDVAVGDRYFLCSDGVTDVLTDQELQRCIALEEDPKGACEKLLDSALRAGSTDNISVCIIWKEN